MATANMTPEQLKERAALEAQRGIARDENGKIIRSAEWKRERIAHLNLKIAQLAKRLKNAKAELKELTE